MKIVKSKGGSKWSLKHIHNYSIRNWFTSHNKHHSLVYATRHNVFDAKSKACAHTRHTARSIYIYTPKEKKNITTVKQSHQTNNPNENGKLITSSSQHIYTLTLHPYAFIELALSWQIERLTCERLNAGKEQQTMQNSHRSLYTFTKCEKSISYFRAFPSTNWYDFSTLSSTAEWFSLSNALYRIGRKIVCFSIIFMWVWVSVCAKPFSIMEAHELFRKLIIDARVIWTFRFIFEHLRTILNSDKMKSNFKRLYIFIINEMNRNLCAWTNFQCAFGIFYNIFHADIVPDGFLHKILQIQLTHFYHIYVYTQRKLHDLLKVKAFNVRVWAQLKRKIDEIFFKQKMPHSKHK